EESKWSFPIVSVSRYKGEFLSNIGEFKELGDGEYLIKIDANPPVRIKIDRRLRGKLEELINLFIEVGQNLDIMEPFSRLEEAIKVIWREQRKS
ncbi:MAG: hypothetical protein N2380_05030, partial [bacterium]|nr:hypothetical protein [bacterium]